ncbi:MAG: OmpA family protein [Candidatus Eisenbacteria bacterium]|nr:OmpA family protein [Candidatus Eisenbacteria bacterium]
MKKLIVFGLAGLLMLGSLSCGWTRAQKGAAIGVGAGGAVGGVIGSKAGNTAVGAILGAMVGGTAGTFIGKYMDDQAAKLQEDLDNARIERIGEGIKVTFDSGILFDFDKSTLRSASQEQIKKFAEALTKYEDTDIFIAGHTDATGSEDYNMTLSRQRAESVANYLENLGVVRTRFAITGFGETQPIASNYTSEGQQLNRRVEVAIYANAKLKAAAAAKTQG